MSSKASRRRLFVESADQLFCIVDVVFSWRVHNSLWKAMPPLRFCDAEDYSSQNSMGWGNTYSTSFKYTYALSRLSLLLSLISVPSLSAFHVQYESALASLQMHWPVPSSLICHFTRQPLLLHSKERLDENVISRPVVHRIHRTAIGYRWN